MSTVLWFLIVLLVIGWLLGGFVFSVGGGLIHALLVIALILFIYNLATGRRPLS